MTSLHAQAAQDLAVELPQRQFEMADVHLHLERVHSELEAIRYHMGRPENLQPEVRVDGAGPRDVYFQARTLSVRANRLSFDLTRERALIEEVPIGDVTTGEVYYLIDEALNQLVRIKESLGVRDVAARPERDSSKTADDVFRSIVQANRQLNLLLDQPFSPSDVYQQVTTAVGYAAVLLRSFPGATRVPAAPAFEPGKQPSDVYRRLIACYERLQQISELSGYGVITLELRGDLAERATPSDAYDVASLLVSDLAFLRSELKGAELPPAAYYPGRKFPSDVFQRVGVLEAQLIELERFVRRWPDWLAAGGGGAIR